MADVQGHWTFFSISIFFLSFQILKDIAGLNYVLNFQIDKIDKIYEIDKI